MNESKNEILATRVGCLGGSDAKLIQGIAVANKIPQSAMKRLAVCKGLAEQPQFTNPAIEFGNYVESMVFESLHSQDERWQSNPCLVSGKYSKPNCKVIDHIDLYLQDDENRAITIGEVKATRSNYAQTYDEYKWQLLHHYLLGCEKAKELGGYKVRVMLCHYCTDGIDLTQPFMFDPSRLTVKTLRKMEMLSKSYHIAEAMDLIDTFLENFTEYYEGDVVEEQYLPMEVKQQFLAITNVLAEIKEKEKQVDEFKKRLYAFMCEKNIKNIAGDAFTITRVDATESKSFNAKRYVEDLKKEHPRKAYKIIDKYTKTTKRNGYAVFKLKEQKEQE